MSQISSLDSIGKKHGTDKSSAHHDYLAFYESFFAPLRNNSVTVLEIGVYNGASLKTWEEYFPNARIIGVDIEPKSKQYEEGRVKIELADQSNIDELTRICVKYGPFDVIVEDGSHKWEHQITSLRTLFPFLSKGGIYIVEDLHTNYGSLQKDYMGVASISCVEYLKEWLDLRVSDDQTAINKVEDAFLRTYGRAAEFLAFYRRACLIKKAAERNIGRPLAEKSRFPNATRLRLSGHLGNVGNISGSDGFLNGGEDDVKSLQGFSIDSESNAVEYRARLTNGSWSEWAQNDVFVGTRGLSEPLTGFTVRLRDGMRQQYTLRAFGRFSASDKIFEVADGEDCFSSSGKGLCGIQVELMRRNG